MEPRPAATVILVREADAGPEVLVLRRGASQRLWKVIRYRTWPLGRFSCDVICAVTQEREGGRTAMASAPAAWRA